MKKLLKLFIGFLVIYIVFNIFFFSKSYMINYRIKNIHEFDIKEVRTKKAKNEIDNYYFEIEVNNKIFSVQTYNDLGKSKKVIKDIKYYKGNDYECILPMIKNNKTFSDVLCEKDGFYYFYNSIIGQDELLDELLKDKILKEDENLKEKYGITIYRNLKNLGLEYYKGLYILNDSEIIENELFDNDKYVKDISVFVGDNYVVADYNEEYEFHKFYVINLKKNTKTTIISNKAISMYSYVQGLIDDEIYIIDTSNKKQYKINIKSKSVIEIGNEKKGIKIYHNQEWQKGSIYDAINNKLLFSEYSVSTSFDGKTYDRVDKVGNKSSGYYYLYEKNNDIYNVYKVNVQNEDNKILIFQTSNIDNIIYIDDYIYYKDKNYIKCYHDSTGVRKILKYNEIEFNESLKFGIN